MKWRRILGLVAVSLAMSGSMLGSDPEKRLQVRWSELKQVIGGKKVTLQLAEGARVEGRIKKVTPTSLDFKITKSSEWAAYPRGKIQIQRETISRIEVIGLKENKGKRVGLTVGTFAGTLIGSMAIVLTATTYDSSFPGGIYAAMFGASTAAAVLVNLTLRDKRVTLIEILPDYPAGGEPKTTNKDQSSNTTVSGEALAASLIEESSAERLRRQSRRAVMRQDLPLDLSSLPMHVHRSGID